MDESVYINSRTSNVFAIIPTKSNFKGLTKIVGQLLSDPGVETVLIVSHGEKAFEHARTTFADTLGNRLKIMTADLEIGIHHMWNMGLERWVASYSSAHCFFVNDDVSIGELTASKLAGFLDIKKEFGIVCPNYDGRHTPYGFVEVSDTCRGRYNGTGGLAGFAMMLSSDLCKDWRFDEEMMWWYGDDDVLHWVRASDRKAGIVGFSSASDNVSWTITNDGPDRFGELVENDRLVFEKKWSNRAF